VDHAVVGLDVAREAGARRRGHGAGDGVVEKVLAEHAAVGDRGALGRGERRARERVQVHDALDDVVLADGLRERAVHRGVLVARLVARGEDGDVRRGEVNAVLRARAEERGVFVVLLEVRLLQHGHLQRALLAPVQIRAVHGRQRVGDGRHLGHRDARVDHLRRADDERRGHHGGDGKHC